ncbi:MAG: hypothetical protein QXW91_06935 [Candidatus Nitrosotenuis sp.]
MSKIQQDHRFLVKKLIDHFSSLNLEIQYADYDGFEKPFVINRHSPDVIAFDRAKQVGYIGQAKMCDEISEQKTKEQIEDYSKKLMKTGSSKTARLPFYIAVPSECSSQISQTLKKMNLDSRDNIHVVGF